MEGSSSRKFKSICVFCGPSLEKGQDYMKVANNLGVMLAAQDIHLVYGRGNIGLLGCMASAAKLGECIALGIIPKAFTVRNVYGVTMGSEFLVISLHKKMGNMLNNADVLFTLFHCLGTLEEISNTTSWAQLCLHQNPLGLLNVTGFHDGLLSFLDHTVEQEFMKLAARCIFVSAPTPHQLIDQLLAYVLEPDPLMQELGWNTKYSKKQKEPKQGLDQTLHL